MKDTSPRSCLFFIVINLEAIGNRQGINRLIIIFLDIMFVVRCTRAKTAEGARGGQLINS